jgi:hypothetical protein
MANIGDANPLLEARAVSIPVICPDKAIPHNAEDFRLEGKRWAIVDCVDVSR